MDFSNILSTIERNRKLADMSSYPFLIEDGGEVTVVWFYYDVRQAGEDGVEVGVEKICVLKNGETQVFGNANILIKDKFTGFEEPSVDEDEYMTQLENTYLQYNRDNMHDLLSRAAVAPVFKAYEAVEEFIKQNRGGFTI